MYIRRSNGGYVLLFVLLLLALAGVALAGLCRATLRQSAAARMAAADLQHRWGAVTAQYTLLDNAANVLERAELPGGPPVATLHGSFELGPVRFDVDLCDEQARANVNGLLAWRGRTAAEAAIRDLARAGGGRLAPRVPAAAVGRKPPHAISTTPDDAGAPDDAQATDRVPPTFGCLTEVFPGATWDDLRPSSANSISRLLTCYGDGKLNVRRADPAVLSAACGPTADAAGLTPAQVADLSRRGRSAGNTFDVAAALAATGAAPDATAAVQGRLIDGSFTQSVWVEAHQDRQTWRTWAVRDATDGEHPRTFTGQW
jgi:hypothetical protein